MDYDVGIVRRRRIISPDDCYFAVPGAAAWTPASLGANLVAWYQADSGVYSDSGTTPAVNNDPVQQWNDKSGNGYNISATVSGRRPTFKSAGFNGLAGVQWTPVDTCNLISAASITQLNAQALASAWVVFFYASVSANNRLLSMTNGSTGTDYNSVSWPIFGFFDSATDLRGFRNNVSLDNGNTVIAASTNYRFTSIFDGSVHKIRFGNGDGGTSVASTGNFGNNLVLSAGADPNEAPATGLDGTIAEIGLTNTALSSTDRSNLDAYLKNKWGL